MNNIITFKNHKWRYENTMNKEELLELLKKNKENSHHYSLIEVDKIASSFLGDLDYCSEKTSTPIVKIAKEFDFKIYKENLKENQSGCIFVNGKTIENYKHDKIILVNKKEELFHQRFVIAHELAHYLFGFVGNLKYEDNNVLFSDTYYKNKHETSEEKLANRFAASILMPQEIFIKQYLVAKRVNSNRIFVVSYLSRFFETTMDSIEKRIMEVLR